MSKLTFAPLTNFADVTMGQSPGSELCNTEGKGLPFLQGCAEFGARHPKSTVFCDPPLRIAKGGAVLISVRAPVGTMNYAEQDYCIGRGLGCFKAKAGLSNSVFLKHAVEQNVSYLHRRSQGSTFAAVSTADVQSVPIPVFRTEKQNKIAEIFITIDQAIEKTEALIEKYQHIKAGLMHDLFTRGIGTDGKLRPPREKASELYQETSVGWLPKGWVVKPLGELCDIASGGTPSRGKSSFWGGSIPWIKTGEIKYNEIVETEEYITQEGLDSSSAKLFRKGTVVMAIYGEGNTRGRVAILGIDSTSNQACVGFSFGNQVQSQFMYFLFENSYSALRDMSNDGSQKNLSSSLLKQFNIAFPVNHNEQIQISNCLLALDKTLEKERQKREKLRQQKFGLMQDLLTGKVQVNVNEPNTAAKA